MPRQNRVTPFGEIIATSARGTFMGNRGILHDHREQIVRPYKNKAWIICRLQFKGRQRNVMSPGSYTELFFLDEATALAAGHRPCYECRRERALAFRDAWAVANRERYRLKEPGMRQIDKTLHEERMTASRFVRDRRKRTFMAALNELPDGVFVVFEEKPCLVWNDALLIWTPHGYLSPRPRPDGLAIVLTPPSTVRVLANGYSPAVHESAGRP